MLAKIAIMKHFSFLTLVPVLFGLCYIDAACAVDEDGIINIALVNRSYDRTQAVNEKGTRIKLSPCGLVIVRCCLICPQSL